MLGQQILDAARKLHPDHGHPRLLLNAEDFAAFRREPADPILRASAESARRKAEDAMDAPCFDYVIPDGVRMTSGYNVMNRVQQLCLAYRVYGDERYAERAYRELENASRFPDFHPNHFLDCATMTVGFAIGYDWLYDWLTPERKNVLTEAVQKHVFPAYEREFRYVPRPGYAWYKDHPGDNWKPVCDAALTMAVLAIFDDAPSDRYDLLLTLAFEDTHRAILTFYSDADGSYSEGPSYYNLATSYVAQYSASLEKAAGSDFGLCDWIGLKKSPYSVISLASNDGISFNFGDAYEGNVCGSVFLWLAARFGDAVLGRLSREYFTEHPEECNFYTACFSRPVAGGTSGGMPVTCGAVGSENAAFRSGWGEDDIFAAVHFGKNNAYHGHHDMGTFILNVGSVRFFHDFNRDNYNLKPYSGCYRFRAEGHNCPVINLCEKDDQAHNAATVIDGYRGEGNVFFAVADMSSAYPEKKVVRGLKLDKLSKTVTVQDEYEVLPEDEIEWFAQTAADAEISADGKTAILTLKGKKLSAKLLADGKFEVVPAAPTEKSPKVEPALTNAGVVMPQLVNDGYRKLRVHLTGKEKFTVCAVFAPYGTEIPDEKPISLRDWENQQ